MRLRKRRSNADVDDMNVCKKPRTRRSSRFQSPSRISNRISRSVSTNESENTPQIVKDSALAITASSAKDKYIVQDDEIVEDEGIRDLLEESQPDTGDPDSESGDDSTLPVRIISYFDIYDYETMERKILPLDIDPDMDSVLYGASGLVRPRFIADDEDDESASDISEDDSILVKLSAIKDVWTNRREIWIQTCYSWYILEYPSRRYRKYHDKLKDRARNYVRTQPSSSRPSRKQDPSIPFVTPRVGQIAQGLFLRSLIMMNERVTMDSRLQNVCVPDIPFIIHNTDPNEIVWGEEVPNTKGFYESVFVDGVQYHINDTVAVAAPESTSSEEGDEGKLSNRAWFAQICYFFEHMEGTSKRSSPQKYFHLRWFSHGSQTILGETANPQALFLLDECDDNPVESILQKIDVRRLGPDDLEPVVISDKDIGSGMFHLSHKWDSDNMTMSTVDLEAESNPASRFGLAFSEQPPHKRCYACAVREQTEVQETPNKLDPDVLEIFDNEYHVHDFVYVRKKQTLLTVAQVVDLLPTSEDSKLLVSIFDRKRPASDEERTPMTERSLVRTDKLERVSATQLDGHCFVLRLSDVKDMEMWLDSPDNFILMGQNKSLKQCTQCTEAHRMRSECEKVVKKRPLRALDLFAGAGGLTTGMDMSGFVKTCWAVERWPPAAESLQENHEDTIVYNQDCNVLLKHAYEMQEGRNPPPVSSLGKGKEPLPPLPRPGEVDIIIGGPPCQPFSGMNRFKRVDDVRQTCIPTFLSYVEFYSPRYAMIENVTGLLHYRLKGRQQGQKIVGGIEAGMVKFVMRAFTSLGYQVQMRVLNSADYGSPQQRNRVIFWAARLGLPLPKWPTPTHIPEEGHGFRIRRVADIGFAPVASRNILEDGHQHAPFYAVTVKEAIDDLPSWDWQDPDERYPKGVKQSKSDKPTFPADSDQARSEADDSRQVSGYSYAVLYASPPRNIYQAGLRKEQGNFARVDLHFTALFSRLVVKRTINIPIRPEANFKDLPRYLKEDANDDKKQRVSANETYWRLDGNNQFRTMMTIVNPASKGAWVIHPYDKRVLTVREQARAQGFPDYYQFCPGEEKSMSSQIKDMERQIGNAVPVHLAYALGRGLGQGLVEVELKRRQELNDTVSENGWDARTDISEEV